MTEKMTNTIRLLYNTLGLPYMSILIHLKPCLDTEKELHLNTVVREKTFLKRGSKRPFKISSKCGGMTFQQMNFVCQEL